MTATRPGLLVASLLGSLLGAACLAVAAPASAAEILSVKNESANFREGPGEKHPILFAADRYYPVEVVEKKDGWARVKDFEGDVAWVAERLLAKQETVVVEGDRVNVRDKASTSAEIVFKAERGEVFKVEERSGKWLRVVDSNGDGGWVRDDMVWGEKPVVAAPPKGKTKGEIEEPGKDGAKPAPVEDGKKGKDAPKDGKGEEPKGEEPKGEPKEAPKGEAPKEEAPKGESKPADAPKDAPAKPSEKLPDAPPGEDPERDAP